jgi:DNA-binding transcriptional regulator YiaG
MANTRTTSKARFKGAAAPAPQKQVARTAFGKVAAPHSIGVSRKATKKRAGERVGVRAGLPVKKQRTGDLSSVLGVQPGQDWGKRLRATRQALDLDQPGFGHLVGCSTRSLVEYEKGVVPKGAVLVRFIELVNLIEFLGTVISEESQVAAWLSSKIPDLGNRTPLELFAAGDSAKIYALVYGAIAGVAQ